MKWIPYVMVRITAVFITGILIGIHFPHLLPLKTATVFLIILPPVYLMLWLLLRKRQLIRLLSGIVGLSMVAISGLIVTDLRNESKLPQSLSQTTDSVQAYRVQIISPAERKERSWKRVGEVQSIRTDDGWRSCSGKVVLYWPLTEQTDSLHYGDVLLVKGSPLRVPGPFNPGEFDYRAYLAQRNIFHQHHVRTGQWAFESETKNHGVLYFAAEARRWTMDVIYRLVRGERSRAILAAFVIGVTDGIDDELKQAYGAGGAMHALAVSGMHVSILYGVLLFLLRSMEKKKGGRWAIALISLLVLWMYGFITGLTPSVLRAVTMFSFVAVAKPLGRSTSILNTLAASAFFLLLFDPWLILSAGFQLSYLAVLGIVLLYRPIYNLWESPWLWLDWVWQITAVSIAAQLATLPITLYYFHQFPVYFLLANLFVIPASTFILLGGILLLIISPIPVVAGWLAQLLEALIGLLNEGLFIVGSLPMSVIQPIPLTLLQAICLGFVAWAIYGLVRTRKFQWVVGISTAVLIFTCEDWRLHLRNTDEFLVHRVARHVSLEWRHDGQSYSLMDSALARDKGMISFHIVPGRLEDRIEEPQTRLADVKRGAELFIFHGLSFLRINSPDFKFPSRLAVNYLIVGNNGVRSLETLRRTLTFDYLILDSSNSMAYANRKAAEADWMGVKCWSVLEKGAFVVELTNNPSVDALGIKAGKRTTSNE